MVTSNSTIDCIALANASEPNGAEALVKTPEFAEFLREHLSETTMAVTFTKKDGTDRRMVCTRNFTAIPADKHPKGGTTQPATKTDAVQVFDIEKQEWRAFNTSNIKHIEWKVQ